jgi:hypothetical protein
MVNLKVLRSILVVVAIVAVILVVLYVAPLVTEDEVPVPQLSPSETSTGQIVCSRYVTVQADIKSCAEAYDFMHQNHGTSITAFDLAYNSPEGAILFYLRWPSQVKLDDPANLAWYAEIQIDPYTNPATNITSTRKTVLLKAQDLSVIQVTP